MDMRSIEVLFVFSLFFDGIGNLCGCRCATVYLHTQAHVARGVLRCDA